ncbi:hypothetical protein OIDMADRAFT_48652 [Oidiodendron maius Zn]|uniref:Uncharacterized protein n=1 Tax=Oidiodendron maius (strain Zn) TaxID=913774 RepID=A0A0C3HKP6_OIDMZ|nr:hypothetical protein OIDMADRAFT_48652 [Oidiodendron maius Zn]
MANFESGLISRRINQCSSTSNHKLLQRRTKAHQRARRKARKISHYNIPYENFVGSVLGGRFQLQYLQYQEDHLDIYSVESLSGLWFEAQAFSLCSLPSKLLQARKRRMKRIHQSRNFVCEIEQAGKRFLILDVERSEAEWRNLTHKTEGHISDSMSHESCFVDFPDLAGVRRRSESFSTVSSDKDTNTPFSFSPPRSLYSLSRCSSYADVVSKGLYTAQQKNWPSLQLGRFDSLPGRSSYAEVASKGLEHDKSSKTKKGVKQRQKRQRKRKEVVGLSPLK